MNSSQGMEKINLLMKAVALKKSEAVKEGKAKGQAKGASTTVMKKKPVSWEERYNQLVEYKKDHNNCNVPRKYKANLALGRWVVSQRSHYKCKKSFVTAERIVKLHLMNRRRGECLNNDDTRCAQFQTIQDTYSQTAALSHIYQRKQRPSQWQDLISLWPLLPHLKGRARTRSRSLSLQNQPEL